MKTYKYILLVAILAMTLMSCNDKPKSIDPDKKIKSNILFNPFSGWLKVTKKYGGPNGYRFTRVQETTTFCKIRYEYPGYEKTAKFDKDNTNKLLYPYDNMVKAVYYANKQISRGILEGKQIMPRTYIRVKWRASTADTLIGDSEVLAW
jgi:hypothetical protein